MVGDVKRRRRECEAHGKRHIAVRKLWGLRLHRPNRAAVERIFGKLVLLVQNDGAEPRRLLGVCGIMVAGQLRVRVRDPLRGMRSERREQLVRPLLCSRPSVNSMEKTNRGLVISIL
jgi:hypothetical protein